MSLVVVGSVAYDGVETPHGKVERMLGGAATYISLAASYFSPVKLVGVVGDDFAREDYELLAGRRIGLEGLERIAGGKTFFWAGVYSADMNDRTTLRTDLNVFADFDPKLPESYRSEPYLFLGNIQPALHAACAPNERAAAHRGDTMNTGSRITARNCGHHRRWDFLSSMTPRPACSPANTTCAGPPRHPSHGAAHPDHQTRRVRRHSLPRRLPLHRPGVSAGGRLRSHRRGDSFAGGFIGYLAGRGIDPQAARGLRRTPTCRDPGFVMGSFCCEKFGGTASYAHARRDRCPLPRIQNLHGLLSWPWRGAVGLALLNAAAVWFFYARGQILYYATPKPT